MILSIIIRINLDWNKEALPKPLINSSRLNACRGGEATCIWMCIWFLGAILPTFQGACHPCCCCVSSAWHHHMAQPCNANQHYLWDWQRGRVWTYAFSYSAYCESHSLYSKLNNNIDDITWISTVNFPSALDIFSVRLAKLMMLLLQKMLRPSSSSYKKLPVWRHRRRLCTQSASSYQPHHIRVGNLFCRWWLSDSAG